MTIGNNNLIGFDSMQVKEFDGTILDPGSLQTCMCQSVWVYFGVCVLLVFAVM